MKPKRHTAASRLILAGHDYRHHGMVNPPVFHASTVLFPSVSALHAFETHHDNVLQPYSYGRRGTPTSRVLEEAIADLEGGYKAKVTPSGLAAATSVLLAFLKPGDHLLMVDTTYGPVRYFCDGLLKNLNIETSYYDPLIGEDISKLIRPNSKIIYCESPGSQTMEVQDIPLISQIARSAGILTCVDNSWSAGYYFNSFEHGCDVAIQAVTKYIGGHSDLMMGSVTCNESSWETYKQAYESLGLFCGADEMSLALRGLRTLSARLERHMNSALLIANWLQQREEVEAVLYPALPGAPGHDLWKRDFTGAAGLFTFILKPYFSAEAVAAMIDQLEFFGIGYSWGGFESLALPFTPLRTAKPWRQRGHAVRLHIGLEDANDLCHDLEEGFARLKMHNL